jgi:cytochrome P450
VKGLHGFTIPKDTVIFTNLWACHFDPDLWENPEEFRPERFLGPDGKFKKSDNLIPFSTGKR